VLCVDNIQAQKVISGFTLSGVCRVVFIQLKDNPTAFVNNVTRASSNFGFARRVFVVKGALRQQPDKARASGRILSSLRLLAAAGCVYVFAQINLSQEQCRRCHDDFSKLFQQDTYMRAHLERGSLSAYLAFTLSIHRDHYC
jgi:hypothetical protein